MTPSLSLLSIQFTLLVLLSLPSPALPSRVSPQQCSNADSHLHVALPAISKEQLFVQDDGFPRLTAGPPAVLTDATHPNFVPTSRIVVCIRRKPPPIRDPPAPLVETLRPTQCKDFVPHSQSLAQFDLFDVAEGVLDYDVWSEWQVPQLSLWRVGCSRTLSFTYSKTFVSSSFKRNLVNEGLVGTEAIPARSDLPPNFLYHSKNVVVTRAKYGEFATLLDDEYVGQHIRELGEWEDCVVSLLSLFFRGGDVVWEGGSHIGTHTVPLARLVGSTGKVHTFEAHPKTRSVLQFNLLINEVLDSVTVHPLGLGGKEDDGKYIPLGDGCVAVEGLTTCDGSKAEGQETNSGGFSFAGQSHLSAANPDDTIIQLTTFDSRLENSTCPSVIKTDLEGMDVRALQGGSSMIAKCRPVIYLEAFAPLRESWKSVHEYLVEEQGYKCFYDSFRTVPSDGYAHYPIHETERRNGNLNSKARTTRLGAMSFNWICHHSSSAQTSAIFFDLVEMHPQKWKMKDYSN
ncbi:hypothetical protein TrVE_jg1658 [Triparma verrucosa]|uniref:Methyltransferase FkbM domain-containing protein n=1 Tax=Triparma verrucosa TaxID=1606542 RepID=A0A9W7FP64_9STRA|nr:hypothetical protein TrVE_jg1658 [Triparma verrucosa]